MAVPGSGPISLGKIRQELQTANYAGGPYTSAATSLDPAENGTYATINNCSPSYPLAANPAKMSEWYGYDHDAPCGVSSYAFDDGGDGTQQNMLYQGGSYWESVVSAGLPNANGAWSLNLWVKAYPNTSATSVAYITGMRDTNDNRERFLLLIDRISPVRLYSEIIDGAGAVSYAQVYLSDTNNTSTTGLQSGKDWADYPGAVTGSTNANGYSMITLVYDAAQSGTDDFWTVYWNGNALTAPYSGTSGSSTSHIYGDPSIDCNWADTEYFVGGFVPSELSAGVYIDEYTFFISDALTSGDVSSLWNGGSPISVNAMTGSLGVTDFLHYNFENASPLGEDTGAGGYAFDLQDFNSPTQTSDHA